jgi:hypothetical protein
MEGKHNQQLQNTVQTISIGKKISTGVEGIKTPEAIVLLSTQSHRYK